MAGSASKVVRRVGAGRTFSAFQAAASLVHARVLKTENLEIWEAFAKSAFSFSIHQAVLARRSGLATVLDDGRLTRLHGQLQGEREYGRYWVISCGLFWVAFLLGLSWWLLAPLQALLDRLEARTVKTVFLVADERGQPFTLGAMRKRFWKARALAGAKFAIRDLRAKGGKRCG